MAVKTKTQQLNILFKKWKTEVELFKQEPFYADGIIDEQTFNNNPTGKKILFITKEPNGGNYTNNQEKNFVTALSSDNQPTYTFAHRIAEWTYGVMHNFPSFKSVTNNLSY